MPRFPISLKLIGAATLLVVLITGGFVAVGQDALVEVYEQQASRLQTERVSSLERRSIAVAGYVGDTAREALVGSEAGRLHRVLTTIVADDTDIRYAAIADDRGQLLARSDEPLEQTLKEAVQVPTDADVRVESRLDHAADGSTVRIREVTYPIRSDRGDPAGFLQLGWSLATLDAELAVIAEEKDVQLRVGRNRILVAGLIALALGVFGGIIAGYGLGRPIRRLAKTAREIAGGNFEARSDVRSRDEIGELADTMNTMAARVGDLLDETRQHAELEQELAVARNIQHALLPAPDLVRRPGIELCGIVEPASHCGGDWWAFAPLTRDRTLVLVGDVTGHGISSAMLTATARSCLDTVSQLTQNDFRVGYLLRILDQLLRESIGDTFHMTCFASIIDPIEGTLTYANAGHNHPYLLRPHKHGVRHGRLSARGNRLGDADGYAFIEHTINTAPGDLLCWYTDGLVEAHSTARRGFGARRLRATLDDVYRDPADTSANKIINKFKEFHGDESLADDVTCVIGRILS
ncbi:MAG: sigma-B regulation protein RsbU (phosphoserine phosphatase) [Myxococcota bacterium]